MKTGTISNENDVIDSRDVQSRIDELEGERQNLEDEVEALPEETTDGWKTQDDAKARLEEWDEDNKAELEELLALKEDVCQASSEWRFGTALIRESYWVEYCQEMVKDIGHMPRDFPSYIEIDWEKTAENLSVDYSQVDYDGVSYFVRST